MPDTYLPQNGALGILRKSEVHVEFTDQYGDQRVIHRQKGSRLSVKRQGNTTAHALNRAAAIITGQRIMQIRLERGMTLEELCVRSGLASASPKQRMYEIERSVRNEGMRFGTLYAIALALEVSVTDLLPSKEDVALAAGVALRDVQAFGVSP